MEIRLEAADGCKMPAGSFLAVKLGDVLKQGRYEPSRTYQFAEADKRRHAKIDLFKHVGSSVVLVSPDAGPNTSEVFIDSGDPLIEKVRLKVDMKPNSVQKNKAAEPVKQAVRTNVETYLSKHGIQEKLSDAVKLLLQEQPEDPVEFICCQLKGLPYPPPVNREPSPVLQPPQPTNLQSSTVDAPGIFAVARHRLCEDAVDRSSTPPVFVEGTTGIDIRDQAREVLAMASKDGSLLTALQATCQAADAATAPAEDRGAVAAPAPDDSKAGVAPVASTQAGVAPMASKQELSQEQEEEVLTVAVQRALLGASKDGTLLKALQSVAPVPSLTGADGITAPPQQDVDDGMRVEGLRQEAAKCFVEATLNGKLEEVLAER